MSTFFSNPDVAAVHHPSIQPQLASNDDTGNTPGPDIGERQGATMTITEAHDFGEPVAACDLIFGLPDGSRIRTSIRLGKPYAVSDDEWACPVEIAGYRPRYADIHGANSMQALWLAIRLLQSELEHFMARGGKVLDPHDESEWDAEALWSVLGPFGARSV